MREKMRVERVLASAHSASVEVVRSSTVKFRGAIVSTMCRSLYLVFSLVAGRCVVVERCVSMRLWPYVSLAL
jgi:hypothetical protein